METVTLGRTGVKVSRIGFGGAPAGLTNYLGKYSPADPQQRQQVITAIHRALELGITYYDTAQAYGSGQSEKIFGEALQGTGEQIFLATKVGHWETEPRRIVEESLRRLRRDRLDLIQIHGDSYNREKADAILSPGGMLEHLLKMKTEGLVRFIGFTTEDQNPAVYRFIETGQFDVIQIAYNLIFQHPAEPTRPFGSLYEARKANMGTVTMRTLTSGIFQKWVQMVNPVNTFDYSPALLQFVLSNPLVDVALVGMRTPEEVETNVKICADLRSRINISQLHERYV
jgi:aryl-alcohol dehydrogenase-like predicted oxidoreductase